MNNEETPSEAGALLSIIMGVGLICLAFYLLF